MTYKKNCVSCGAPIPIKRKHYNKYGSYCAQCTRVATKQSLELKPEKLSPVSTALGLDNVL